MDLWPHPGLGSGHREPRFGEPLSQLDLELCDLMCHGCHSGQNITRQQAKSELVRVVEDDRVVDGQVEGRSGGPGRRHRTSDLCRLHP